MLKSAGDAVLFEMVSFPVFVSKVHVYEAAVNEVPVFNCRATSVARVVPSYVRSVNATLRFVETLAVEIS